MQLPKLEIIDATRKEFRLLDDWQLDHSGNTIVIPKGFITDLASVPSPFFWWQWGKWNLPAIVHDWAYLNHFILIKSELGGNQIMEVTRVEADRLFHQLLENFKVPYLVRKAMYLAVRIGGKKHW